LDTRMVCTAPNQYRHACGDNCDDCKYLTADRRKSRVNTFQWSLPERRSLSHLLPHGLPFEGVEAALGAPRVRVWQLPAAFMLLLLGFNALDAIFTARALSMGVTEANPVMAGLMDVNIPFALAAKFMAVSLGAWLLWRYRHLPVAWRGMQFLTVCYSFVVVYHLVFQLGTV
jgi:hypothetical protein